MNKHLYIGKFQHQVLVTEEFSKLAQKDEEAAEVLANVGYYQQACYFILQAMEKNIRAQIFSRINPNLEYYREKNHSHSVESAIKFLLELSKDATARQQIIQQLNTLGIIHEKANYSLLHNNLRYPFYSKKYDSYSSLRVTMSDYKELKRRLELLKDYLKDIHKLII